MKKYRFILLFVSLLLAGCSSSDGPNDNDDGEEFPEYEVNFVDITVPANIQNQADNGDMAAVWAVMILENFEAVNDFGSEYSASGNPAVSSNRLPKAETIYTRTFDVDGVTITMMQEITNDFVMGEVTLNGTQGSTGFVFQNWMQSEMMCLFNTYEGYFKAYRLNSTVKSVDIEWTQETSELLRLTYYIDDGLGIFSFEGDGYYNLSTSVITFHFTSFDETRYDMRINRDGTGEYTHWAATGGVIIDEGTW